ncbi:metallophosphoesterase [Massilia timonae]|uniref:metallophosphoesterase n=2 Tax=Telluria group TaxID=2895353 RepID=UPI000482EE97|nr:metallophosphoesterase [Massilia timonae]
MKLLVLSDLHLEVWCDQVPKIDISLSQPDVVILAGDIHTKFRAPSWASEIFSGLPVVYVAGNHEFYGETIEKTGEAIARECICYPNIHYLNCGEYIYSGVRFLGATLWTDFALFNPDRRWSAMLDARTAMNDYQRIKVASAGYRKLHPQDTARLHAAQRAWLKGKLDEPFTGPTIVVTHMAPSMCSISSKYVADPLSAAFASNMEDLIVKADVWIHGHTHNSSNYDVEGCRVVSNPLGYPMQNGHPENEEFDPNFIVHLKR